MTENGELSATSRGDLNTLLSNLGHIDSIRQAVDAGSLSPVAAFQKYSDIIDTQNQYYYSAIQDKGASFADVSVGVIRRGLRP